MKCMNNLYDEYLDMLMESDDGADGVAEERKENEERAKRSKKKIIIGIAAAAACIAIIATIIIYMNKNGDKIAAKKMSKLQDEIKGTKKELEKAMKAKELSADDEKYALKLSEDMTNMQKKLEILKAKYKPLKGKKGEINAKINAGNSAMDLDEVLARIERKGEDRASIIKDKKIMGTMKQYDTKPYKSPFAKESADDMYDSMIDAICEKYNNDEIDATTCVALMERAAERYMSDGEDKYSNAVTAISESFVNDEIDEDTCNALLERAAEKYL